ncbi:hypothetical protein D3C77_697430 [compost metagenome]
MQPGERGDGGWAGFVMDLEAFLQVFQIELSKDFQFGDQLRGVRHARSSNGGPFGPCLLSVVAGRAPALIQVRVRRDCWLAERYACSGSSGRLRNRAS